jgi:outer membrane receptor for ferrienterochelin and colicins
MLICNDTPMPSVPVPSGRAKRLGACALAAFAMASFTAEGQTVDYGALGQLFGEPVTASATGSPQRVTQVPLNMEIITAEDIRRSGADSIPDVLQFIAGISVRRYSFEQAEVAVRGYNQPYSPRLLVLVNGRQVYLDDYGRTAWQAIPVQLAEIRQIEVVKGPNSALFGFNAVAGVVNIITYDPLADSTNSAAVRGGTQNYAASSGVATLHAGDTAGLRLSAGAWRAREFPTEGLPALFAPYDTSPYQYALSADSRFKVAANVELTAEGTMSRARGLEEPPAPFLGTADYQTRSIKLGLSADTAAGLVTLQSYLNRAGYIFAGSIADFLNNAYVVQANDLFKLGSNHTLRLGLEYRYNDASGLTLGRAQYAVYSVDGMWNWQLAPQLAWTNSVRFDHLRLHYAGAVEPGSPFSTEDYNKGEINAVSFNSGMVCDVSPDDTVRLMVGRGVQAPSLIDLTLQLRVAAGGTAIVYSGNPNLDPTSVTNYELDYDRKLAALNATLRIAAFYEDTHDLLAGPNIAPLALTPTGLSGYAQNVGSSSAAGAELTLKGITAAGLRWSFGYALISITDHLTLPTLSGPALLLDYDVGSPKSAVAAGLGYTTGRWELDLEGRWQSRFTDFSAGAFGAMNPVAISDQLILNARAGYKVTEHLTLAVSGAQLADNRLLESAGTPVERRVTVSATADF